MTCITSLYKKAFHLYFKWKQIFKAGDNLESEAIECLLLINSVSSHSVVVSRKQFIALD